MFFKKLASVASIALLITLAGCGGPSGTFTGTEDVAKPVYVVKIDDTREAHPQIGINQADLVFIEQVEGGLTRLAAVFSKTLPPEIGPVRSARISDIELLAQFGKVAFLYSGAQTKFRPVLKSANLFDLSAEHESPKLYSRKIGRNAPVNMVINTDELLRITKERKLDIAKSKNLGWNFGKLEKQQQTNPIKSATIKWPASRYEVNWNGKGWAISQNGEAEFDSDGKVVAPSTFVIQKVSITDSEYRDKVGGVTPFSATVGTGNGWILRNGFAVAGTWNRLDESSGTTWVDQDGKEIKFATGQIWIALTDQTPAFVERVLKK
ncbi:MAG: hypothetical protein RL301_59 [Actinomycetota bacterium]